MSPRKYSMMVRKKKEEIKSKSKEGIFIVGRRRHPRFSMELPLDDAIESAERRRVDFII